MSLSACPELAAEWADQRDIATVSPGSKYKARWRCHLGHQWTATVYSRVKGAGCPVCSNRAVLRGFNDLPTTHPALALEWRDERDVHTVTAGSNYAAVWECEQGHTFTAPVLRRANRGSGCLVCMNRAVVPGQNDVATLHPDLATEWADHRDARSVHPGSKTEALWRCPEGHLYKRQIRRRVAGDGCTVCSGRTVLAGVNDFASTHPSLLAEYVDERDPGTFSAGAEFLAKWKCSRGHEWQAYVYRRTARNPTGCPSCAATAFSSQFEAEIADFIESLLPGMVQRNARLRTAQGMKELDVFIPGRGVAVEANGAYYHSERFKPADYHADKLTAFKALGIRLIQVWEDDWADRRPIVERMLAHKLGASSEPRIPARTTTARTATTVEAREFLNANHIQGFTGATHYLGLEHGGRLVALMSLKRTGKPGELRLERYATAAHVLGGQSKLIRYAESVVPGWSRLVTFADHEVSDGALYERTGWVRDGELAPDYKYLVRGQRVHKFNYRLARFRDDPALEYDASLTERQLAELNGLPRVWDSGKTRYRYDRRLS